MEGEKGGRTGGRGRQVGQVGGWQKVDRWEERLQIGEGAR